MNYYEVLVADIRYRGVDGLTYSFEKNLRAGQIVKVPLRGRLIIGVVINKVSKPGFKLKKIEDKISNVVLPAETLQLIDWLRNYYPSGLGSIAKLFLPTSLLLKKLSVKSAEKVLKIQKLPRLTANQQAVVRSVQKLSSKQRSVLLHGETGSGKTRVYIELARSAIASGKSVIILTPEISLTPQLASNFENTFKNRVLVLHSSLPAAKRREVWLSILVSGEPLIVIGPRSALFVPLKNIGLVVVDEAHETAYKQEQAPYYNALRVAGKLAQLHGAQIIFGTATPSVTEYFLAQQKAAPILRLAEKPLKTKDNGEAELAVIGTKNRDNFTRQPYLADVLLKAIESALASGGQSLVFLNRRGTARIVACQNCDWQALCPNCDLPLTYHGDSHLMRCHTCGYRKTAVSSCPICGSSDIVFASIGTKALADSLIKLFPKARVVRFDTDNTQTERFEKHYQDVLTGQVDILVGTQILAKGLDLPKLAVVGVIAAETSLYFPDYTAEERTYQLIHQVLGRVGRGHRRGRAIIQARNPEDPAILSAVSNDWPGFYQRQLQQRRKYVFPPYCYLLKLTCKRKTRAGARQAAEDLLNKLQRLPLKIRIIGPTPSFYERSRGYYQWQLVIKARNRDELLKVVANVPPNWTYDLDPVNLL